MSEHTLADAIASDILTRARYVDRPEEIPDMATALDVQDAVTQRLAGALGGFAGYKVAWNTAAQLADLGLAQPGTGRLFADQVRQRGAHIPADAFMTLMVEPEIVAILKAPLGIGATVAAARAAIGEIRAGFELLDRRGAVLPTHTPSALAGNIFNAGLVVGTGATTPATDLGALRSRVMRNGALVHDGIGSAPDDPVAMVAFLADHFGRRGAPMQAGDLVLCGSHTALIPVAPGDELTFMLGDAGEVSFKLTP